MNTCSECKHALTYCWGEMDVFTSTRCAVLQMSKQDPVTGKITATNECRKMRADGGLCGPEGMYFSQYTKKTYEVTRHPWMVWLFGGPTVKVVTQDERIINAAPPG